MPRRGLRPALATPAELSVLAQLALGVQPGWGYSQASGGNRASSRVSEALVDAVAAGGERGASFESQVWLTCDPAT
jgi:hypothetical protein